MRTEIQLVASVAVYDLARELLIQTQALAAGAVGDLSTWMGRIVSDYQFIEQ